MMTEEQKGKSGEREDTFKVGYDEIPKKEEEIREQVEEQARKEKEEEMEIKRNKKMMADLLETKSRVKLFLKNGQEIERLHIEKVNSDSVVVCNTATLNGSGYYSSTAREINFNSIKSIGYYDKSVRFAILKGAFEKIVNYDKNGSVE